MEDMDAAAEARGSSLVAPGDVICPVSGYLRGHGTHLSGGRDTIVSSVLGFVETVDKLVSVKALRGRYRGEIGDVVVGRITEVAFRKWNVDIQSKQNAVLLLSAIRLVCLFRHSSTWSL